MVFGAKRRTTWRQWCSFAKSEMMPIFLKNEENIKIKNSGVGSSSKPVTGCFASYPNTYYGPN
jgi:hypothetical protein